MLVSYIDTVYTTGGAKAIAAQLGVPGYAPETDYNTLIIGFWLTFGPYDAGQIWANPIGKLF